MKTLLTVPLLALAGAAQAHITLDQPEAPAGSSYRAVFKVGHGCEGGAATKAIVVTLPGGLRGARPMPKPGWTLTTLRRPLKTPLESHGQPVTDELAEVRWTADSEASYLPDAWYDEFILRATLPSAPGELTFAVRQVCTQGEWFWAELPTADNPKPRAPAVRLRVTPTRAEAHAH
ncbi:YcnI family protein [Roseateles sp.]|uniref:YcnI family copper-binding membrane protein n=1 Tax=Roseateles sp. TaxID=1971397 RepID=UPI0025DEB088|nr:YcnI family protein [Roseateles sp.]MBV8036347.1 YcnI family protein [Roseateles sp.]